MLDRGIMALAATLFLAADTPSAYRYPMDQLYALSGSFGELRNNHFHSGIDIRTNQRTGYPVYAIEEGYVYRIKVSPFGFGKALYLKHPDGNYSVYAHLDKFSPDLEAYARDRAIADRLWIQEIYPEAGALPVKRGAVIAFSGNSGSSSGPHLHFEIRDSLERILNPLVWYKGLISDRTPPLAFHLALEPIADTSLVEGSFSKKTYALAGGGGAYSVPRILPVYGPVGVEYHASDRMDGSGSPFGIQQARLLLDGERIFERNLTRFAFEETRCINLHIDYAWLKATKQRLERAYREPGNAFPDLVYHRNQGIIELHDQAIHTLTLELIDFHGNTTRIAAKIQQRIPARTVPAARSTGKPVYQVKQARNILAVTVIRPPQAVREQGLLWDTGRGSQAVVKPWRAHGDTLFFAHRLSPVFWPVVIRASDESWSYSTHFSAWVTPGGGKLVEPPLEVVFKKNTLFSPMPVALIHAGSEGLGQTWALGQPETPVWEPLIIRIAPPPGADTSCLVIAYRAKKSDKWEFAGAERAHPSYIEASWSAFGEFCLMADSTPPVLSAIDFTPGGSIPASQTQLRIQARDNFSGIDAASIQAEVNGVWIPLEYRFQTGVITWAWGKSRPAAGRNRLRVKAADKAGNPTLQEWTLTF